MAGLTSRDVAKAAGVSQATVSNVLNRPHLVSDTTLEKVRDTMKSMGFVVNDSARTLRAGRSRTLGVIILDLANPFWGEVMRGIEAAATPHDYSVLFGSSDEQPGKEEHFLRLFHQHRVHAVLVSALEDDSDALQALRERGTKIVLVDRRSADGQDSSVSSDDIVGARQALGHLLDMGHRRIAFINGPHEVPWCADRYRGAALEDRRSRTRLVDDVLTELTIPSMTAQAAEEIVDELLGIPDVTAAFCANDLVALGVLRQLSLRGVSVPGDLSLVGYDDSYFASLLSPALTTVRQEPFLMGKYAAQIAIGTQADDSPEARVLQPSLVQRQSVQVLEADRGQDSNATMA